MASRGSLGPGGGGFGALRCPGEGLRCRRGGSGTEEAAPGTGKGWFFGNGGVPSAAGPALRASWRRGRRPWPLTGCIRPGTHLPPVPPAPLPRSFPDAGYEFDICFTSVQKRAIRTLWTVLDAIDQMWLPVIRTWRLNERHYGALTGLNKAETAAKHGEAQVKIWRRSYDIPPPPMQSDHPFYSTISKVRPIGLHLPCWEAPKSHLRSL